MKKADLQKVHHAMKLHQACYGSFREETNEAMVLLQAELDRPESEPVGTLEIWIDGTSGYPHYDLALAPKIVKALGEGVHDLYTKDAV